MTDSTQESDRVHLHKQQSAFYCRRVLEVLRSPEDSGREEGLTSVLHDRLEAELRCLPDNSMARAVRFVLLQEMNDLLMGFTALAEEMPKYAALERKSRHEPR
jgi:hypothetical protein